MFDIAVPAMIGVALIVVLGIVFTILYKRATRDEAFVRTGLGGKKVVLDGGAMILPIFHSYASVNLKTLRLTVERKERESLITKDRLRVDIVAEFYVRVRPDEESIALASQTLGALTNDAEALRNQVEAKFVDGLRSVAATMTILELQEKRSDFVKHVQSTVESDVKSNGLELESVSLTKLDQTDVKFFNPENFFDAEGLTQLKTITETRRRDRNAIVRDNEVAIAQKDLEARQQTLGIERTKKEAELSQERDIANKTASTRAEVATATQTARLTEENARIDTDRAVAEKEAGAKQVKETAVIESDLAINKRKTDAQREIQIATQENEIQIAAKSKQTSEAVAEAKAAEALAVSAEEKVVTARAVEVADRARLTQVLAARTEAERKSTELIVAAEAEKRASLDRAEAVKTLATAEAESNKIKAVGVRNIGEAEAAVITMKNEAQNKRQQRHRFRDRQEAHRDDAVGSGRDGEADCQSERRSYPAHRRRVWRQRQRSRGRRRLRRRACRRIAQGARPAPDDRRDPAPERFCAGRRSRESFGRRSDREKQRGRGACAHTAG